MAFFLSRCAVASWLLNALCSLSLAAAAKGDCADNVSFLQLVQTVHLGKDNSLAADKEITHSVKQEPCDSCGCTFLNKDGIPTNCDIEINSRNMVARYIPENASVLEVGARYGSVSCAIASKLKQSGKQVSVDADRRVWGALEKNRVSHGCNFHTVHGLLGKKDGTIMENGFGTFAASTPDFSGSYAKDSSTNSVNVPHHTLEMIQTQHGLKFDAGNFDCEGCAAYVFKDFPELKTQLNLIILESHNAEEEQLVDELVSENWELVDSASRQRVLVNKRSSGQKSKTAKQVQWAVLTGVGEEACPDSITDHNCINVCARKGLSCNEEAFHDLKAQSQVKDSFNAAGLNCNSFVSYEIPGTWDGPWAKKEDSNLVSCGFNSHSLGITRCALSPACGYRRLCPCA